MTFVKVGAAALNQTPLDWDGNAERILAAIKHAKEENVQLLCLPELCITGYGCEDAFLAPYVLKLAMKYLDEIASEMPHGIVTSLG